MFGHRQINRSENGQNFHLWLMETFEKHLLSTAIGFRSFMVKIYDMI